MTLRTRLQTFKTGLHGQTASYTVCDTLQVNDYFKYDTGFFSEEAKKAQREVQFPKDLEAAYKLGMEITKA